MNFKKSVNIIEQLHFVIQNTSSGAIASPFGIIAGLNNDGLYGSFPHPNLHQSTLGGSLVTEFSRYAP